MNYQLPEAIKSFRRPIIMYGTGEVAECFFKQLQELSLDHLLAYYVSTYSSGSELKGRRIIPIDDVGQLSNKGDYSFLIASYGSSYEMKTNLCTFDVPSQNIFIPDSHDMPQDNNGRFWPKLNGAVNKICFYPNVLDEDVINDLHNRIGWYIPDSGRVTVSILSDNDSPNSTRAVLDEVDLILVWDQNYLYDPEVLKRQNKVASVDPRYIPIKDCIVYSRIHYWTLSAEERAQGRKRSISNFSKLRKKHEGKKRAYIFGTGPSLEEAYKYTFSSDSIKVICNKIINNKKLLDHVKPDVLVFSDPLFFSYSDFGKEYRKQVEEVVEQMGVFIVVPEQSLALLLAHSPQLARKAIGLTVHDNDYEFPSEWNLAVKETGNVVTRLGIPLASKLAKEICLIGCDGAAKTNSQTWEHSHTLHYDELKLSAYEAHPGMFEGYSLPEYYVKHCEHMRRLIEYGESLGIKYYSLTPSYIPALEARYSFEGV